jgi:arginyl-tRNA synthetase
VSSKLEVADLCEPAAISGPGFLNCACVPTPSGPGWLERPGEHLFFTPAVPGRTVVIDFSSPNVAKPLHVGHIRSTFLGDCLARVFRLLGHHVVTDNHIGDWGTQFGMLLVGWKTALDRAALAADPIAEMERLYKVISARCQEDPPTRDLARAELVKLQAGDPENLALWREMQRLSQAQFDAIYARLGVRLDHTRRALQPAPARDRRDSARPGIARESEGAVGSFRGRVPAEGDPLMIHKDGEWQPNPFLVRKSDGVSITPPPISPPRVPSCDLAT